MKPQTLLLLGSALLAPAAGLAAGTTPAATSTLTTTVAALGYPSGFTFDDTTLPYERTLLFPLPQELPVTAATLRLIYRGSPQLDAGASLSVTINDLPAQEQRLARDNTAREWQLPIPPEALGGGQLKVTVRGTVPTVYERCINGQPQSGAVHVAGDSSLLSVHEGLPRSLRDAWLTLPEEVTISLPEGPLDEALFRAALDWVVLLRRHHRTVSVTTLPDLGNMVIAPEPAIRAALVRGGDDTAATSLWSESGGNLGVVRFNGGVFIAATAPYADVQRFATRWQTLTAPLYLDSEPLTYGDKVAQVALETLGIATVPALLGHKLQWNASITPWNLPPGMRPVTAELHVAMPRTDPQQSFRLYAYLNDMLVTSERLAGDGRERQISLPFSAVRHSDVYQLRVVVRDGGEGDCTEPGTHYPIRITPQSHVTLEQLDEPPSGFSSLPTALGQGFDLYVPTHYLAEAPRQLPALGELFAGFVVPPADYRLIIHDDAAVPAPSRLFIAAGERLPDDAAVPMRFDQGAVQLVNAKGQPLIDEQRLHQHSVIQLVHLDEVTGLWLHAGDTPGLPVIDASWLGENDVAIYDTDHLVLTLDSRQADLAHLRYPEAPRWFERLHAQRFLWLVVAWILLTLGMLYLYIKARQHRKSGA